MDTQGAELSSHACSSSTSIVVSGRDASTRVPGTRESVWPAGTSSRHPGDRNATVSLYSGTSARLMRYSMLHHASAP